MALTYLKDNHAKILDTNYRCKFGEIDIVATDGQYLSFVEVKYRKNNNVGFASEAVDINKQIKICRVSDYYRMQKRIGEDTPIRYDVITIDSNNIDWIKNAYEYLP